MSEHTQEDADRQRFELLLPFYTTQNLNEEDLQFVRDYLENHPEATQSLDFIRRLSLTLKSIGVDRKSSAALDRLLENYASIKHKSIWRRLVEKLRSLGVTNIVAVAILVIVAQSIGFIVHLGADLKQPA